MRIETVMFWLLSLSMLGLVLAVRWMNASRLVRKWVARQGWRLDDAAVPVRLRDVIRHWPIVCEVRVIQPDGNARVLTLALGNFFGNVNEKVRVLSTAPAPLDPKGP